MSKTENIFITLNREWHNSLPDLKDELKYIHVGIHRTGSTFLQNIIFPKLSNSKSIFSNEAISGSFFSPGYEDARELKSLCPDVKIIIVLRNQHSLINSFYSLYLKVGGTKTYKNM